MADINGFTDTPIWTSQDFYQLVESDAATRTDTVTLTEPFPAGMAHVFVGIKQLDSGDSPVVSASGSYTVEVMTKNNNAWEALQDSPIDATSPTTISVAANIHRIRVTPVNISVDVAQYTVVLTANRS